ncbi:hypothetical protein C8A03DRAFT_40369 [Achaetomium macrosporum]|uniref:Aminoglycoside phosphotransferase domain-containing protein n=1 Tax=Achaetomium macrosporum TaxID=79813 RepID=A0AAN7HHG7_9PEZI|nr:hypothetical protein C8A03DRAFT_40369 [Achaetomium macrosporum]
MPADSPDVRAALAAIYDADLPHPGGHLLECFVDEAVDKDQAARYLLDRCPLKDGAAGLDAFLSQWTELITAFNFTHITRVHDRAVFRYITKRDGAKCCVTSVGDSFLDPLVVVQILPALKRQLDPYHVASNRIGGPELPTVVDEVPSLRAGIFIDCYLYGYTCGIRVHRLPFGLYLKHRGPSEYPALENEYRALDLMRRDGHIPVPRPLDLACDDKGSYLLTSALPGRHIGVYIDTMTDEEVSYFIQGLRKWVEHIRSIPKTVAPEYQITDVSGKGCHDARILMAQNYDGTDYFGPFKDEVELNNQLRCGALPDVVHRAGHKIVFTHGDINMRNIMVKDGKLSGIIDWENSGWYPDWRWVKIVDKVCEELGDYKEELAIERKLWDYCF